MSKRVGILGGTGFVGRNLSDLLTTLNIDHICVSRRTGLDVADTEALHRWLLHYNITHVVNLAAECGGIGLNKRRPADLWAASTEINLSVLRAVTSVYQDKGYVATDSAPPSEPPPKLIMVGTVCSYARDCPPPFKESDLMCHGEPESTNAAYGVAKLAALFGARAFYKQYWLNITNLLPVNMYGPWDHFDLEDSHVVPAMIKKIDLAKRLGNPLVLWGTGKASREFLYAGDFAQAVVAALDTPPDPTFMNVGTGKEVTIKQLVATLAELMDYKGDIDWDTTMPDGQPRRCLEVSRARKKLGWEATTSLKDGLSKTIEWYYAHNET